MARLAGKKAIVTGGATAVGSVICRMLLAEGASVLVADACDADDPRLTAMQADFPGRALVHNTNVTDEASVAAACAEAKARWGNLDIAVAGTEASAPRSILQTSGKDWDDVIAGTVRSAFLLSKHVIPQMVENGGGSIIAVSSVLAMVAASGLAARSAASGAIRAFVKAVACETVSDNIRVNSVHVGETATAGSSAVELAAPCTAEDVGWGCVFLASEEARFVSGAELVIDGGFIVT